MFHRNLIAYMKRLGYKSNDGGICFGFACMWLQAVLSNDLETFDARIEYIKNDYSKIHSLTPNQRMDEGIVAFLDGIEIYYDLSAHAYIWGKNNTPKTEQNVLISSQFVMSQEIENQGGLTVVDSFCGAYTLDDLEAMFTILRLEMEAHSLPDQAPFVLLISSASHTFALSYLPNKKQWAIGEAEMGATQYCNNDKALCAKILEQVELYRTTCSDACIFNMEVVSTERYSEISCNIHSSWKRTETWIKAHEISENKINDKDALGSTLLFIAAQDGHIETVNAWIKAGGDLNHICEGITPLFIASQNGHVEVVEALIRAGADVNLAPRDEGATPLYISAQEGHTEIVKMLLEAKADFKRALSDGSTPLYVASQAGHTKIAEALLHAGADSNRACNDGTTPRSIAYDCGFFSIIVLFLKAPDENMQIMPLYSKYICKGNVKGKGKGKEIAGESRAQLKRTLSRSF